MALWPSGLVAEWTEACVKLFDLGSNPFQIRGGISCSKTANDKRSKYFYLPCFKLKGNKKENQQDAKIKMTGLQQDLNPSSSDWKCSALPREPTSLHEFQS